MNYWFTKYTAVIVNLSNPCYWWIYKLVFYHIHVTDVNINHYSITSMLLMHEEIIRKSSFHNIWLITNVLKIKICFELALVLFCYTFYDCSIPEWTLGSSDICVSFQQKILISTFPCYWWVHKLLFYHIY